MNNKEKLLNDIILTTAMEGDGTKNLPYQIRSIEDFYHIADNPNAYYEIMNDINFNGIVREPMGEFIGTLDGDGHTLTNLKISSNTNNVGLFTLATNATIKNLRIKECSIDADVGYVGIIAGQTIDSKLDNIQIDDSYIKAKMKVGGISGYSKNSYYFNCSVNNTELVGTEKTVGGFTGDSFFCTYNSCCTSNILIKGPANLGGMIAYSQKEQFIQCSSLATIIGATKTVGGLLASVDGTTITQCYTSGNLKGKDLVAGFIGSSTNLIELVTITDSYSNCMIDAEESYYISGLCNNVNTDKQIITNCYYAGEFYSSKTYGLAPSGIIDNSYFDDSKLGLINPITQARTTENMYKRLNYEGWDFEKIWCIDEGISYPRLQFETNYYKNDNLEIVLEPTEQILLSVDENILENEGVNWSSSNSAVATIDNNGKLTALDVGRTVVTVLNDTGSYRKDIHVLIVEIADNFRLAIDLKLGEKCRLTFDGNTRTKNVIWISSDINIAAVTGKGKVKAISNGLTIITAIDEKNNKKQIYIRNR